MHLVKTVCNLYDFRSCALLKYLGMVVEFIEVIQVSGSFVLIREMGQKLNVTLRSEDSLLLYDVLF